MPGRQKKISDFAASKRKSDKDINNGSENAPSSKKAKPSEDKDNPEKKTLNRTESSLDEVNYDCDKLNTHSEPWNLKICSWNVAGIRAALKKNGMEYLKRENADIVALQETKCEVNKMPPETKLKGYKNYYVDSKKAGYCGLALFSKVEPIKVTYGLPIKSDLNDEGRMITAEYEKFYLINVYVPNAGNKLVTMPKRLKWNEEFKKHVLELDKKKPVVICGDMNVAHEEIDLANPKTNTKTAGFTKEEREGMTDFLGQGFVDTFRMLYPEQTGAYTFWSYFRNSRDKNIGWRLDYFIVPERIKGKICDVVNRTQIYGSDHCPVVCYINL